MIRTSASPKYASINGLRAISISLVVIHHLALQNGVFKDFESVTWLRPFLDFITDGQLGVNVFFVISGFLITALLLQEEARSGTISLKNFYIRRTLRIFPAYYTLLLVYFIIQELGYISINRESWITALTYTKYFMPRPDWYTGHAWSLSIEEHFYLFWPVVFLGGPKFRRNIAILFILLVPVARVYLRFPHGNWIHELSIFTRIDAIATGCLFAIYREEILSKLSRYLTFIFYGAVALLFFLRYLPDIADKVGLKFIFAPLGVTTGTIANFLIALIMFYSVFGRRGLWFKMLNLKVVNFIGVLSYSIYLWQQVFLYNTNYWINSFPQNVICALLAAVASYYFVEKPFLKLKSRFTGRQPIKLKPYTSSVGDKRSPAKRGNDYRKHVNEK